MKPPPRTRCLPSRLGDNEPNSGSSASSNAKTADRPDLRSWTLREKQNMHRELRMQREERQKERAGRAAPGGDAPEVDPDVHRLLRRLPKRNEQAVLQMLRYLKEMVLLETKRETNSIFERLSDIEVWYSLAERATGSLNDQITDAFARVFMVAATVACDDVTKRAALTAQNKQGLQPQRSGMAAQDAESLKHDGGRTSETSDSIQGAASMQEAAQKLDYENIYLFLHDAVKAKDKISPPELSPLESAVILDLLLSLPEEISRYEENLQWKDLQSTFSKMATPLQAGAEVPATIEGEMEDGEPAPLNPFALPPSLAMLNVSKEK
uniref:snRNA-activating protein complex subunit 2 n=1 Tax=Myxine glutinosa TaxID=7769 RepID=UPI00358E5BB1